MLTPHNAAQSNFQVSRISQTQMELFSLRNDTSIRAHSLEAEKVREKESEREGEID